MSNPFGTPPIETLDDWNAYLSCCCSMPSCPTPALVCESLTGALAPYGFFKLIPVPEEGVEAEAWQVYRIQTITGTQSQTHTENFEHDNPSIDGQPSLIRTSNVETVETKEYDIAYHGSVGSGGDDCPVFTPVMTTTCSASLPGAGTSYKSYGVRVWSSGEPPEVIQHYVHGLDFDRSYTVESVTGVETEAHIAWETEAAEWDTAHPDFETEMSDYETDHSDWTDESAAWEDAYSDWAVDYWEWDAGGQIGDEPTFDLVLRDEPTEPEARPAEPGEFYPDCFYKVVQTQTYHAHIWGYLSESGSAAAPPADEMAFKAWYDGGQVGSPPCPGSGQYITYATLDDVPGLVSESFADDSGEEFSYASTYAEGLNYAAWMTAAGAVLDANLTLPKEGCTSTGCSASMVKPDEESVINLTKTAVRYRWRIPAGITYRADPDVELPPGAPEPPDDGFPDPPADADDDPDIVDRWTGTYFKITWDVLTEPDEYGAWKLLKDAFDAATEAHEAWVDAGSEGTAPIIPDDPGAAPTPAATLEADLTWTWATGPGTGDADDPSWFSEWFNLAPPTVSGERRVVNIRYECYRGPYGHKPQTTGDSYEITE